MKDWTSLGTVVITASTLTVDVGSFSIDSGDDTIWLEVKQLGPSGPWPFSFGIAGWLTSDGYELGTTKAYMATQGEVFSIGVGRAPRQLNGRITYEPRSYNLSWVKAGGDLTLAFSACSGVSGGSGGGGGDAAVSLPVVDGSWVYNNNGLTNLKL